jgi:hypothetical protein
VSHNPLPQPAMRRLNVYAFDPNASLNLGSAKFNLAKIALTWNPPNEEPLQPGPVNDYFEVIDIDPASNQFYEPVDLEAPDLMAQDGLPPSEGDPRFHQQMVFAVAMKTVRLFERALGRKVLWASRWSDGEKTYKPCFKLRIYPHALREQNAYYSHNQSALLFGYFKASHRQAGANWVFTALSHDIIVHETTHAILDGLHPRFSEATSLDSLAFHEAFADIAALFSHFMLGEAVSHFIAKSGGNLDDENLLSGLASQFAKGTSDRETLRTGIDKKPSDTVLETATEAHERGAILVAAVFDAFLTIYNSRIGDLLRIAEIGPSTSPHLHPDLVARMTDEAMKSADHVLRMCIRALDYLPPVDVRFGDFLRGIVTADADLIADDKLNYRLAFVEAFRRRGIYPSGTLSMSPDNLLWPRADRLDDKGEPLLRVEDVENQGLDLLPLFNRPKIFEQGELNRRTIWYWLAEPELCYWGPPEPDTALQDQAEMGRLTAALNAARLANDTKSMMMFADKIGKLGNEMERDAAVKSDARRGNKQERREFSAALALIRRAVVNHEVKLGEGMHFVNLNRRKLRRLGFDEAQFKKLASLLEVACKDVDDNFPNWANLFRHVCKGANVKPDEQADRRWEDALGVFFDIPDPNQPGAKQLRSIGHRHVFDPDHPEAAPQHIGTIQIATVRATRRSGPDGEAIRQLIVEVTQRRYAYLDPEIQAACDRGDFELTRRSRDQLSAEDQARWDRRELRSEKEADFIFRGGATLIIDLGDYRLRYHISKKIDCEVRLEEQRQILQNPAALNFTYDRERAAEPFALLHRH